jgi:hypothetical protein
MRHRQLLAWGSVAVALILLGLLGAPRWVAGSVPAIDHDIARWLFVLAAWGILYPLVLWPGEAPGAAPEHTGTAHLPFTVELHQIPMDRRFERAKEVKAERERAQKVEGSKRLVALREEGHRQIDALDGSLGKNGVSATAAAQALDWIDSAQASVAEWISPSKASWMVSAPFEGAPNGLDASARDGLRSSPEDALRYARAVAQRLDEVLRDS